MKNKGIVIISSAILTTCEGHVTVTYKTSQFTCTGVILP